MTDSATDTKVRCSAWARDVDLSPLATIGSYSGYLLVETPLPWPKDVSEIEALSSVTDRMSQLNVRIQALVPRDPRADPANHRVILHTRPTLSNGGFAGYLRYESTRGGSIDTTVDGLLSAALETDGSDQHAPDTDLLVCTHGRRDACCGSQGTDLALALAANPPQGVHLWRTSHTGGHRFAPTFLLLPQATAWAFADVALVNQVVDRSVPFSSVASHYRGCPGLAGPQVQALERDVLESVGWELLDRERSGYLTEEATDDGGQVVRLEAGADRWEAVVRPGRTLPVPDCMKPLSEARKTETEWTVTDLRALS